MKYCTQCGKEVIKGEDTCSNCGVKLDPEIYENKNYLKIILPVLVLGLIIFIYYLMPSENNSEIASDNIPKTIAYINDEGTYLSINGKNILIDKEKINEEEFKKNSNGFLEKNNVYMDNYASNKIAVLSSRDKTYIINVKTGEVKKLDSDIFYSISLDENKFLYLENEELKFLDLKTLKSKKIADEIEEYVVDDELEDIYTLNYDNEIVRIDSMGNEIDIVGKLPNYNHMFFNDMCKVLDDKMLFISDLDRVKLYSEKEEKVIDKIKVYSDKIYKFSNKVFIIENGYENYTICKIEEGKIVKIQDDVNDYWKTTLKKDFSLYEGKELDNTLIYKSDNKVYSLDNELNEYKLDLDLDRQNFNGLLIGKSEIVLLDKDNSKEITILNLKDGKEILSKRFDKPIDWVWAITSDFLFYNYSDPNKKDFYIKKNGEEIQLKGIETGEQKNILENNNNLYFISEEKFIKVDPTGKKEELYTGSDIQLAYLNYDYNDIVIADNNKLIEVLKDKEDYKMNFDEYLSTTNSLYYLDNQKLYSYNKGEKTIIAENVDSIIDPFDPFQQNNDSLWEFFFMF